MATFIANSPIITDTPTIEAEGVQPGDHRFQLVVEDNTGLRSAPDIVVVTVGRVAVPKIVGINPAKGQQGISVDVVITGANLLDAKEIIFDGEGIKAEILPRGTAEKLLVRLMIDRRAPTGPRRFKVITPAGAEESPSNVVFTVLSLSFDTHDFRDRRVDEVNGIGPTYTARLKEKGITNLAELASMEPGQLAEVLRVSKERAGGFIEEAQRLLQEQPR